MHSSYQHHETHYADMSLPVHERIEDLNRRGARLAPRVAESALDSGCTDVRPSGPRQSKAWDMVAEAHGWNAISDSPELLAQAEQLERDGIAYRVEYVGGMDPGTSPWEIVTDTPQPEVAEGDMVIFDSVRATVVSVYPAGPGNPYAKVRLQYEATGNRETVPADAVRKAEPQDEIWTRIQVLAAQRDEGRDWTPQLEDEYYRLLGQRYDPDGSHNLREPEPQPEDPTTVPDGQFDKVTLLGPGPWGGTYTSRADDPQVPKLLAQGYTVYRTWTVVWRDGKPSVINDSQAQDQAEAETERQAAGRKRELDQAQHDANRLYLNGEMTAEEHQRAVLAISAERDTVSNSAELAARFPGMERETAQQLADEADDAYPLADPRDLGLFIRQETAPVNRTKIGETLYRLTRRDDGRYPVTEITHEDR